MNYSKIKPRQPDWNNARQKAYEVLRTHNIQDFPINILDVINQYPNLKILTYKDLAKRKNLTISDVMTMYASEDGFLSYDGRKDRYLLLYNDQKSVPERIYWTLAHEFGHYILGHLKNSGQSNLSNLSDGEYKIYEQETDYFVRYLINPPSIIQECKISSVSEIKKFFKVSHTAANNTLEYLRKFNIRHFTAPDDIKNQLSNFILKVNHGKTCSSCDSFFVYKNSKYCPCCGNDNFNHFKKGNDFNMLYPGIKVDHKSRAKICPHCNNEELDYDGDFCNVCSSYLINKCGVVTEYDPFGEEYISSHSCEMLLSGNARFCHKCGNPSTFLQNGYLHEWNHPKIEIVKDPPKVTGEPILVESHSPFY